MPPADQLTPTCQAGAIRVYERVEVIIEPARRGISFIKIDGNPHTVPTPVARFMDRLLEEHERVKRHVRMLKDSAVIVHDPKRGQ